MPIPSALPRGTALFTFHGRVVRGKRLGSRLGFPTANIAYDPQSRWTAKAAAMCASSTRADTPRCPKAWPRWRPICWATSTVISTAWV